MVNLNSSEAGYINPMTIIMVSTIGLVILQLFSIVMEAVFGKDPIYLGPFFLAIVIAGAVYVALGIVQGLLSGYGFGTAGDRFRYMMTVLFSMVVIAVAYIVIPKIVPDIFMPAVGAARTALGFP